MAASTQWRVASWSGAMIGLDYAGAKAAAAGAGLRWRKVFAGLRVMEAAVIGRQRDDLEQADG